MCALLYAFNQPPELEAQEFLEILLFIFGFLVLIIGDVGLLCQYSVKLTHVNTVKEKRRL